MSLSVLLLCFTSDPLQITQPKKAVFGGMEDKLRNDLYFGLLKEKHRLS